MDHDRVFSIHIENAQLTDRDQDFARQVASDERDSLGMNFEFSAYRDWLTAFSGERIKLLKALREQGPLSIRALSKSLNRDYKSVHGDVSRLMEIGLIEKREDGLIEAPYDKIISEIRLRAA
jgi:predicted transcriptional regulator